VGEFEIHRCASSRDEELSASWDMPKRWRFSESIIHYEPEGMISRLLREKVPLRIEERRRLLISGITLTEWYIKRLTALWVDRGSIRSAHSMFDQSLRRSWAKPWWQAR
jgi:hypothetical protein